MILSDQDIPRTLMKSRDRIAAAAWVVVRDAQAAEDIFQNVVPGFDKKRTRKLPAAAIRYVLDDERIHPLVIGMPLQDEVDANIETLSDDVTYTLDDRALLAESTARAFDSDAIKRMRVD